MGMCGNGMCQRRGRESLSVAVRWEVRVAIYRVSVGLCVPCLLILYLVGSVLTKLRLVPVGECRLKESQPSFLFLVHRLFVGEGITANVWLFAVAGIGGFKNGAQRNVKADLL